MKINDIILIFILLICSFIPFLVFQPTESTIAIITLNNKPYKKVDLNVDDTFTIETENGKNTIEIKNKSIAVTFADCKDNICVKSGAIRKSGEIIACIPHNLLIEISDKDD